MDMEKRAFSARFFFLSAYLLGIEKTRFFPLDNFCIS
jgi:hypothetical protein